MKAILRSFIVFAVVLTVGIGSSSAYFTANAVSTNNQITTGTMKFFLGSNFQDPNDRTGQVVVQTDKNGSSIQGFFTPILDVEPGVIKSSYVAVVNYGSLEFQYKMDTNGAWQNTGLGLNNSYMSVVNYHRYEANNCESDVYCQDLYYWLADGYYSNVSAGASDLLPSVLNSTTGDANRQLKPKEFTIYRLDWKLNDLATNPYQGETFLYNVLVDAKQVIAPTFF